MRYLALLLLPVVVCAQVPFLSPEDAVAKMDFGEDFRVTAFAHEPALVQPFAFTFDTRGRVWACENLNYDTRRSDHYDRGPVSRIIILEDTDGDGHHDTRKVFTDKVVFPTGLALGHGGVWVGSPPNLLFIPDRNRDDVPDGEPEIVLDGWGRQDRHETLNSFLWGPDGWLYGCHGVFTHSKVGKPGTPDDEREPINAGVWRYHPSKEKFEVFAWGTSNPWGLDFNAHGQIFITACVIPHLWHMIQGGRYHRQGGKHFNPHVYNDIKTIADHRHKSAHGGARFYQADSFPEEYHGRLFMCNLHEHNVLTDEIVREGSGYKGLHGNEFLASNDKQWLGFNMELGPDGSVYLIDWHDQDICGRKVIHEQTGRLYRLAYKDTKGVTGLALHDKSDAELVALLSHKNAWYMRQARLLLHERAIAGNLAEGTSAALRKLLSEAPTDTGKLRALWALHVTGLADSALLTGLLDHDEEHLRAWAIQLLAEDKAVAEPVLAKFAQMAAEDSSAVVRLFLASAMQRLPVEQRWDVLGALAARAEDADDHNLPLMVWYALEPCVPVDKIKALTIAKSAKLPNLTSYVARRMTAKSAPSKPVIVKPKAGDKGLLVQVTTKEAKTHPKDGDALLFHRDSQPVVVRHQDNLSFGADADFTLAAKVRIKGKGDRRWQGVITKSRDAKPWYGLWIDSGGRWCFGATGPNLSGPAAEDGWHWVVGVQQDGRRRLYLNGKEVAAGAAAPGDGRGDLWIGGAKSVHEMLNGSIADARVYNRALSLAEIAALGK